jgi:hypothetical protein
VIYQGLLINYYTLLLEFLVIVPKYLINPMKSISDQSTRFICPKPRNYTPIYKKRLPKSAYQKCNENCRRAQEAIYNADAMIL